MARYSVQYIVHASTSVTVEAGSYEEAIELSGREVGACLCCQCAREVNIGDIGDVVEVLNLDTGEFFSPAPLTPSC